MFDAIASAPGVECGVIGLPDDKWGERVHALIAVRLGRELSAEQVIAHCREHIASYKCPARHRLPRRDAVVAPYWKDRERKVN